MARAAGSGAAVGAVRNPAAVIHPVLALPAPGAVTVL